MLKMLLIIFGVSLVIVALPVLGLLLQIAGPIVLTLALIIAVPVGIGALIGIAASKVKGGDE